MKQHGLTLAHITEQIADLVVSRAKAGLDFGVILIPEGLIDFVPEVATLIAELNDVMAQVVMLPRVHCIRLQPPLHRVTAPIT